MKDEIKERRTFDDTLKTALRPNYIPDAELNRAILAGEKAGETKRKGMKKWYVFPRVAVAAAAVVLIGSAGVYAATKLLKPTVTDHAVSVGNTEYVDDAAIANTEEPASTKQISSEAGDENVKWTSRNVSEVNGYTTTVYNYDSYAAALEDAGMKDRFTVEYPSRNVIRTVTEDRKASETQGAEGYRSTTVSAEFTYRAGVVEVLQDRSEVGVSEDSAYSVKLSNTSNERNYTTKAGLEFTLVDTEEDGELYTTVMVSDGKVNGYLQFRGLSEDEIREVLDTVKLQ